MEKNTYATVIATIMIRKPVAQSNHSQDEGYSFSLVEFFMVRLTQEQYIFL
jgi:hypothetical protein